MESLAVASHPLQDPNRQGGSGLPREIGDSGESPLPGTISRGEPPVPSVFVAHPLFA